MRDKTDTKTAEIEGLPPAPSKRGRPAQHASAADRQRAYRQRLKERGMRTVSRIVRDVRDDQAELKSDVLDLSEVRRW